MITVISEMNRIKKTTDNTIDKDRDKDSDIIEFVVVVRSTASKLVDDGASESKRGSAGRRVGAE